MVSHEDSKDSFAVTCMTKSSASKVAGFYEKELDLKYNKVNDGYFFTGVVDKYNLHLTVNKIDSSKEFKTAIVIILAPKKQE